MIDGKKVIVVLPAYNADLHFEYPDLREYEALREYLA